MESVLNFITDNSQIFLTIGVVIVLAIIGFIGEKVRNKDKTVTKQTNKPEIKKEENKEKNKKEDMVLKDKNIKEPEKDVIANDPVYGSNKDTSFDFNSFETKSKPEKIEKPEEIEGIDDDLFAPIGDINPAEQNKKGVSEKIGENKNEIMSGDSNGKEDIKTPEIKLPNLELPEEKEDKKEEPSFNFFAPKEGADAKEKQKK